MARYILDSAALDGSFSYTGIVAPKTGWVDGEDRKRTRSNVQERDDKGVALWLVSTTILTENYGRLSETVADVTVPSLDKPKVTRHTNAEFIGLAVEVRVNKNTGNLVENFTALGLVE